MLAAAVSLFLIVLAIGLAVAFVLWAADVLYRVHERRIRTKNHEKQIDLVEKIVQQLNDKEGE